MIDVIKAVFFDFDGVLTIDATGTTSIVNYISEKTGIDKELFNTEYRKFNADLLMGYVTHKQIWGDLCNALDHQIPDQVLLDCFLNTTLDPQMIELAKRVKSQGYKVGMITDNKTDRINTISEKHQFDTLFDTICVSAALGVSKSGKDIFMEAMRKADVSAEECVFIDNTPKNLEIPAKMGMSVIHYDHDKRDFEVLTAQLRELGVRIEEK